MKLTQLVERNESVKRINKEIRALDEQLKNLPPPPPPETENADAEKPDVQKGKEKKKNTIRRKK